MWFRIGHLGPVWCTERPYGVFRMHGASDTSRHVRQGTNMLEAISRPRSTSPACRLGERRDAPDDWQHALAHRAYRAARALRAAGLAEGRRNQARWAVRLAPTPKHLWLWLRAGVRAAVGGAPHSR